MKAVALAACSFLIVASSCRSGPDFYRVDASVSDARLAIVDGEDEVLHMTLPADLSEDDVDSGPIFRITKEGYRTFEGTLEDMMKLGQRSYYVALESLR